MLMSRFRDKVGRGIKTTETMVGVSGSFRRNALVLTAGTLTAQALPLLLYPIFTRIYEPAAFGVFATISLFSMIAALLASGAYESAVLIAPSRRVSAQIVGYALMRSSIVLAVILAAVLLAGDAVLRLGVDRAVHRWLPLVPFVAAAGVVYNCYSEWCVRHQYFGELSRLRIWQTSAIAVARLILGVTTPLINGFVLGDAVGKAASAIRSGAMLWSRDRPYFLIHTMPT
jgi:lipopolysaccharide exporter